MGEYSIHIGKWEKTEGLKAIEETVAVWRGSDESGAADMMYKSLNAIARAINSGDKFIVPVEMDRELLDSIVSDATKGGEIPEENRRFRIREMQLAGGDIVYVAFTDREAVAAGDSTSTATEDIAEYLEKVLMNTDISGLMLNPWTGCCYLPKQFIKIIFECTLSPERENSLRIVAGDITDVDTECIVNVANNSLLGGGGVDGAIHLAAGPGLLEECRALNGCRTGEAKLTGGYDLKADYVIHMVGPVYSGREEDAVLLRRCYWNSLELARANDIHSIAFPSISAGAYGYPQREAAEVALSAVADWMKVNPRYGMDIWLVCYTENAEKIYRAALTRIDERQSEVTDSVSGNDAVESAIHFATDCHSGDMRKGSDRPYILHPIETAQILSSMRADNNLIIAGLLHDTVEDTDITLWDICERFGTDVAALVNAHTEDKRKVWYLRKLHTIEELKSADIRPKMLVIADKVANLRDMYCDYTLLGDELWKRFNAPKALQSWYYSGIIGGLDELQNYPQTADVYWEMVALYKELFVTYRLDEKAGRIYQLSVHGENYVLCRETGIWEALEDEVPENAVAIARVKAERIEDNWAEQVRGD